MKACSKSLNASIAMVQYGYSPICEAVSNGVIFSLKNWRVYNYEKKATENHRCYVPFIALVSFWGYDKYFKSYQEVQQQLNNQFGAEFFNSFRMN